VAKITRSIDKDSTARRGSEATAMRDSAHQPREAKLQSASDARDNFGKENVDSFRNVQHPDLSADYVLATPERGSAFLKAKPDRRACRSRDNPMPFNDSDYGQSSTHDHEWDTVPGARRSRGYLNIHAATH
jgi:hypothetical protein